jgi:hypothetical protein
MVSVQRTPTLSYVVLPEGTRRGSVFTVHETGAPVPPTCLRTGTTSAPSKSSSGTAT